MGAGQQARHGSGGQRPDPFGDHIGNTLIRRPKHVIFNLSQRVRLHPEQIGRIVFAQGRGIGRNKVGGNPAGQVFPLHRTNRHRSGEAGKQRLCLTPGCDDRNRRCRCIRIDER